MSSDKNTSFYDKYGTRRAFVRFHWFRALYFLGFYRKYRQVKWGAVERLVFVCKGNICRSPYAETVAKSYNLASVSCGLDTTPGDTANILAQEAANRKGRDIKMHRTTPLSLVSIGKGDLLVAMEPWHIHQLENHYGKPVNSTLLGLWCATRLPYISDPYGRSPSYYDHCFDIIEQSIYGITSEIRKAKDS